MTNRSGSRKKSRKKPSDSDTTSSSSPINSTVESMPAESKSLTEIIAESTDSPPTETVAETGLSEISTEASAEPVKILHTEVVVETEYVETSVVKSAPLESDNSTESNPELDSSTLAEIDSNTLVQEMTTTEVLSESNSIPVEVIAPENFVDVIATETFSEAQQTESAQAFTETATYIEEPSSEFIETVSESISEPTIPSEVMALMVENIDNSYDVSGSTTSTTTSSSKSASSVYGNYEDYQLLPEAPWPPPIFIRKNVSPQERYYIEHRWYSQWSFFDKKATENKNRYYRTQIIVGVGSVTVPVLVGIRTNEATIDTFLYIATIIISLSVAISTAIESLYTYGDNWRSYRKATEDLNQEKSMYDVKAGRYENNAQPFIRFVERCEEIIAQQNGLWVQSQEKQAQRAAEQAEEFLDKYIDSDDENVEVNQTKSTTSYSVTQTTIAPATEPAVDGNIITPAPSAESANSAG